MINEKTGKVNGKLFRRRNYSGVVSHFVNSVQDFYSCGTYLYSMEQNQKINIRIRDDELKRLKLAIAKERKTMSEIIRRILQQYIMENPQAVIQKSPGKKGSAPPKGRKGGRGR